MKKTLLSIIALAVLTFISSGVDSATVNDVKETLKNNYAVTKRSLIGKIKKPGTVLVIRQAGIPMSAPKVRMVPITLKRDGTEITEFASEDVNLRKLRVGDRVHIYRTSVNKDGISFHVGTETPAEIVLLGQSTDAPLQALLRIEYPQLLDEMKVDDILTIIDYFLVPEDKAAEFPDLLASMQEFEGQAIPRVLQAAVPVKGADDQPPDSENSMPSAEAQSATQSAAKSTAHSTAQSAGQSQASPAEEKKSISCAAADWEGTVANIADLFECDSIRAIQSLSAGRQISFKLVESSFSDGAFRGQGYATASWYSVFWERLNKRTDVMVISAIGQLRQSRPQYTIICKFPVASIGNLKENEVNLVSGKLTDFKESDYSGSLVAMDCEVASGQK